MRLGINHFVAAAFTAIAAWVEFECYKMMALKGDETMAKVAIVLCAIFLMISVSHIIKGIILIKNRDK